MLHKEWKPQEIFSLSTQTWGVLALQTAVKLDLFTKIDLEPGILANTLSAQLAVNERALGMLLTALVSMQFLERKTDQFFLTQSSKRYLSKNSDEYYGSILLHGANILRQWVHLDKAIQTGEPILDEEMTSESEEKEREDFLMGMFNVAQHQAHIVADAFDLTGRTHLLDIGGGPGTYAIHFCKKNPTLRATIFDLPTSQKYATAVISKYKIDPQVDFKGGDFLKDPFPTPVDVTWLSQVLHGESPENSARLVQRASDAMVPGGLMGIQEFMLEDDLTGPMHSALFSLNMLLQTNEGQSYTKHEIKVMMEKAGLHNIRLLDAQLPPSCAVWVGEKK